jgi:hypothetical protein
VEDLDRYLDEIVEPIVKEFEENPSSVRHAFVACVVVFHTIDYLAFPRSSSTLRQMFRKDSIDFALIDEVAHAFKHVETGKPQSRLNVGKVISHGGAFSNDFSDDFDISKVTVIDRPGINLLSSVKGAVTYLRKYKY